VTLVVPMPVFATSYENAKSIVLDDLNLPHPLRLGIANATYFHGGSGAFADFFQEGQYSAFVAMTQFAPGTPNTAAPDAPSRMFVLRKNDLGQWIDATSSVLPDATGCISPRKGIVADFNGDGRPDVFYACHGVDAPPFPGEAQRLFLSQANGSYANVPVPFVGYTHGGSAADLNADGRPDLVLTWTNALPTAIPYVLINNGNGTFTRDFSRLPSNLDGKAIYSLELIDLQGNGRPDLLVSGLPPDATGVNPSDASIIPNGILRNDGNGSFLATPYIVLPNPPGSTGIRYSLALDFIHLNGFLYMSQVDLTYSRIAVQKVMLSNLSSTHVYEHFGAYSNSCTYFTWMYPASGGRIVAQNVNVEAVLNPASCNGVSFVQ